MSFEKKFNRLLIKHARKISRGLKRTTKPLIRGIKSQIRKKKQPGPTGSAPRKRTGVFRKSWKARSRFRGSLRMRQGVIPLLRVQPWLSRAKPLLSVKTGKAYRSLKMPSDSEVKMSMDKALAGIKPQLDQDIQNLVFSTIIKTKKQTLFKGEHIQIDFSSE